METAGKILDEYECEHFDSAQLELSVVQLKFPPIARFDETGYMAGIKEALTAEYPLMETAPVMNLVVSPQGISQSEGGKVLRFSTIDRAWTVGLAQDSVSLETREYTDIAEFSRRFTEVLADVEAHLRPRHQLRLGLRYINEFRHRGGDTYAGWLRLLNPDLLGLAGRGILGGTVEHTLGEVRTRRDDGVVLVRHGFLQGSTVMPAPGRAPKAGPFYLLDLDYFDESPHKFDARIPGERMERYNSFLFKVFRWAITDGELYRHLKVRTES